MSNSFSDSEVNKTYLYKYFHKGSWWTLEIPGVDRDDAQARINKLPLAQYQGEVVLKIPASGGLIARCICWLRNSLVR
ncbi:MAG: hypothetical protein AB7V46_00140 [Thermomicrobiales bacterium]